MEICWCPEKGKSPSGFLECFIFTQLNGKQLPSGTGKDKDGAVLWFCRYVGTWNIDVTILFLPFLNGRPLSLCPHCHLNHPANLKNWLFVQAGPLVINGVITYGAPKKWSYGPLLKTGIGPPCRCFTVSFRESKRGENRPSDSPPLDTRHPAVPRKRGASEFFGTDSFPKIQSQSKMVIV